MSDRKAMQYNLCSNKQGKVHMPIHKQLCDDREFLTEMLGKQSDPADNFSQDSDLSASDSELDCSGLVSQSDNEVVSDEMTLAVPTFCSRRPWLVLHICERTVVSLIWTEVDASTQPFCFYPLTH